MKKEKKKDEEVEKSAVYGRKDLNYWQEMAVEIAEELVPRQESDYFVPYVNFVMTEVGKSRLHEVGHVTDHIMRVAGIGQKVEKVVIIGPRKGDIPKVIDALGAAKGGSEVKMIFPENCDADLTRATAIVSVTQRIPFDCLAYMKETEFVKIQNEEGKYLHFLECIVGKEVKERLFTPIRPRPLVVFTMKKFSKADALRRANEISGRQDDAAVIGPRRGAEINKNWAERIFMITNEEEGVANGTIEEWEREEMVESVNRCDELAEAHINRIDHKPSFYVVKFQADEECEVREELHHARKRMLLRTGYGVVAFEFVIINGSTMIIYCERLAILCEVVEQVAERGVRISTSPEEGACQVGTSRAGSFTATPIGQMGDGNVYHVTYKGGQISKDHVEEVRSELPKIVGTGVRVRGETMTIYHKGTKVTAMQVVTCRNIGDRLPMVFGHNNQYELCKGENAKVQKFMVAKPRLFPHGEKEVSEALQEGATMTKGKRICINLEAGGGHVYRNMYQEFVKAEGARHQWFVHKGMSRGKKTGVAIIEGHKVDIINMELMQLVGRPPMQDEMRIYRRVTGHGPEINPEEAVGTQRAVCVIMEGCTMTFDAGTNGKGGQGGTVEPCRIKMTFPEKGTAMLWGHAAKTLRIKLHDHEGAACAIGSCRNPQGQATPGEEGRRQTYYAGKAEEHSVGRGGKGDVSMEGDFNECGNMTAYRRAAAEAPQKGRKGQKEEEDITMDDADPEGQGKEGIEGYFSKTKKGCQSLLVLALSMFTAENKVTGGENIRFKNDEEPGQVTRGEALHKAACNIMKQIPEGMLPRGQQAMKLGQAMDVMHRSVKGSMGICNKWKVKGRCPGCKKEEVEIIDMPMVSAQALEECGYGINRDYGDPLIVEAGSTCRNCGTCDEKIQKQLSPANAPSIAVVQRIGGSNLSSVVCAWEEQVQVQHIAVYVETDEIPMRQCIHFTKGRLGGEQWIWRRGRWMTRKLMRKGLRKHMTYFSSVKCWRKPKEVGMSMRSGKRGPERR